MFGTIFRLMVVTSLRDKISLFYSVLFPLGLLIGLGLYFDTPDYQFRLLTGMLTLGTLFWGVQGIAFQIHQQRNRGVYKLLKLTPFPTISFVVTMTLARTLIGLAINAIVLAAGLIVFDISMTWKHILGVAVLVTIGLLCFTALGFFISNLAKNEAQINMFSNMLYLPMLFCTETFYSLQSAPGWIRTVGDAFPLTYMVQGLRSVTSDGSSLLSYTAIIAAFTLGLLIIAAFTFRWDSEQALIQYRKRA